MSKPQLLALWPCHSWEDFPLEMPESSAASLLACWTSLWHPTLINRFQVTPAFWRADKATEIPPGSCISIPAFSLNKLDDAGREFLDSQSEFVLTGSSRRELSGPLGMEPDPDPIPGYVSDFYSLGFCWLQLHLLTRQIRYAGSLDENSFGESLIAAAALFASNPDSPEIRSRLQKCFDLLLEERNRFYPSDANLYRVLLARPVQNGKLLLEELAGDGPVNLLASAADLQNPESVPQKVLERVIEKLEVGQLSIVSPGQQELPTLQCHTATAVRNMYEGQKNLKHLLGSGPEVFARRTSGLSPIDPEIAAHLGCKLALHAVFDAEPAPEMSAPNALWQSPGGETLPAIAGKPLDASRSASMLRLGAAIGEMIDSWHYAHILIGYWPGNQSESFQDLSRSMNYGNLMGRFRSLGKAVETLATQTWGETSEADDCDFRSTLKPRNPALRLATALQNYWRQTLDCLQLKKSAALLSLVDSKYRVALERLEVTASLIDRELGKGQLDRATVNAIDQELSAMRAELAGTGNPDLLIHPSIHSATLMIAIPSPGQRNADLESTSKSAPVRLVHQTPGDTGLLVRAPPSGFVGLGLGPDSGLKPSGTGRQRRMVDGLQLRNGLLSVDISPKTGGIATIQRSGQRHSVASQRLAVRMPKSGQAGNGQRYASMQADSVEIEEIGRITVRSIARGRLVWQDQAVAHFEQQVSLSREQPFVVIDVSIVPLQSFHGSLWNNSVCSRLAWIDESSSRYRYLQEARTRCCREFFTSPLCTEIESGDDRISLFTGGNTWHRQSELNIMDTLLPESAGSCEATSYRLGIGLDVPHPLETAIGLLGGPLVISRPATFPDHDFRIVGWGKSTLHWNDSATVADQDTGFVGLLFRFRESQGKAGELSIRFATIPQRVELQDFAGKRVGTPQIVDGKVVFAYRVWQYLSLAVYWNQ